MVVQRSKFAPHTYTPKKKRFYMPVPISFYGFYIWNLTPALQFQYINFSSVLHPKKKKKNRDLLVKANNYF